MNSNLAVALGYLGFSTAPSDLTPKKKASAFFNYLFIAGYLSPDLIEKAVTYLHEDVPFRSPLDMIGELNSAVQQASAEGGLDVERLFAQFGRGELFDPASLTEIVLFLQQTAFDRRFGVERDRLMAKPWMEERATEFLEIAQIMGVIDEPPVVHEHLIGIGIMGASSFRVESRINYFLAHFGSDDVPVVALSGNRELSQGLDAETVMKDTADFLKVPVQYEERAVGEDRRIFLTGVTETQMVHYLLVKHCPGRSIGIVDSQVQEGHWRATTQQNATDIAPSIVKKAADLQKEGFDTPCRFVIIAEQPHSARMAMDVQRAVTRELKKQKLPLNLVTVEGCGQALDVQKVLSDPAHKDSKLVLANLNSALATFMSAWYQKARDEFPNVFSRNPATLMFSSREREYAQRIEVKASEMKTVQMK